MIPLPTLISRLSADEDLCQRLHYQTLSRFFDMVQRFLPRIVTTAPRRRQGFPALPANIRDVLALSLALCYEDVDKLWAHTGEFLMNKYETASQDGDAWHVDDILSKQALQFDLGM